MSDSKLEPKLVKRVHGGRPFINRLPNVFNIFHNGQVQILVHWIWISRHEKNLSTRNKVVKK